MKKYACEALAVYLDFDPAVTEVHFCFASRSFRRRVLKAIEDAEAARSEGDTAAARAAEGRTAAARALVRRAHLSMRDAAEALGVSHQPVQQLVAS